MASMRNVDFTSIWRDTEEISRLLSDAYDKRVLSKEELMKFHKKINKQRKRMLKIGKIYEEMSSKVYNLRDDVKLYIARKR